MYRQIIGLLTIISTSAYAEEGLTIHSEAASELQSRIDGLTSYSATFQQTTHEQDGFLLDEQEGRIFFTRPGRLRWESDAPFRQTLVADGENIYLYDPDLNQVTVRPWSEDPAENPSAVFVSGQDLSAHFSVNVDGQNFTLSPLDQTSSLVALEIHFDDQAPIAMIISDTLGQTTRIDFRDGELGAELNEAMFVFDIPEGAEVITDG